MKSYIKSIKEGLTTSFALLALTGILFLFYAPTLIMILYYYASNQKPLEFLYPIGILVSVVFFNYKIFKHLVPYDSNLYAGKKRGLLLGIKLMLIIVLLISYYALTYYLFYLINSNLFIYNTTDNLKDYDFFYFSTITFATVGYGDIYPNATITRLIASLEVLNSIVILIFLVANFESLKKVFDKSSD